MYKYWTAFETEEHFLYPREVAYLWQMYSCTKPNAQSDLNSVLAGELLKESCQELGKESTFYETKTGLKRVFDQETIAHATSKLKERVEQEGAILYCRVNGKRYKFVIGEQNVLPALIQQFPERFEEDGTYIPARKSDRIAERKLEIKRKKAMNA